MMMEQDNIYTFNQKQEILRGKKANFSKQELSLYADPKFSWEQMAEIRQGIEEFRFLEKVKVYAKPEFSPIQMREIRRALRKFPEPVARSLADSAINDAEMHAWNKIKTCKDLDYPMTEFLQEMIKKRFTSDQIDVISLGITHFLDEDQIRVFANKCFSAEQMSEIEHGLRSLPLEQVCSYADKSYAPEIMHSVRLTYENEQVDLINWIKEYAASHHMPVSEKSVLLDAAQKGYSKEQLKIIMNADLSVDQKTYLIKTSKAKVTIHDIQKMPVRKSRFSKDTNFEI